MSAAVLWLAGGLVLGLPGDFALERAAWEARPSLAPGRTEAELFCTWTAPGGSRLVLRWWPRAHPGILPGPPMRALDTAAVPFGEGRASLVMAEDGGPVLYADPDLAGRDASARLAAYGLPRKGFEALLAASRIAPAPPSPGTCAPRSEP